ncbi:MAG: VOC family protein [Anaerolineaceae bacterium]|nr:VOC family protein [Anaerolineaceae bacterium]
MIKIVGTASVFVADQQRAKDFYVEKLGMELRLEAPLFPGTDLKWIEVAPSGAETSINLYKTDDDDENWGHYAGTIGKAQAITIQASDLENLAADLRGRGVTILQEPVAEPWGNWMSIQDSEGNTLIITADTLTMRDG